jgi:carbohydrate kinase (thermoresistant glucokinase family)
MISAMVVVIMGAAGAGKSTIGRALAARLEWPFIEGDDLHPAENVARMAAGIALDDADRAVWLSRLHDRIAAAADHGHHLVVACSALRERYRAQLTEGVVDVRWVFLRGSRALLHDRLSTRQDHFAGPSLLDSQLETLEPPLDAIELDAARPAATLVDEISRALLPQDR